VPGGFVLVADEAEVGEGEIKGVYVVGHPVALCRVRGKIYACSAECTYEEGADLTQGKLEGFHLTCPEHGCTFDVRSGRIVNPPAEEPLPTYECRVENGRVWVAQRPRGF
jgi:3-phenylpropionate/trans-cinnamate dioxygenase ferredoxin subunit